MDNDMIFGQRIKELREERGLSMDMVVYDINDKYNIELNKSTLSRWETGKRTPTLRLAAYLCLYYNVSLDYLMGFTDSKVPTDLLAKLREKTKKEK